MKLQHLTIDGSANRRPIHLDRISNGLTFVYGENSSGKSSVGHFLRELFYSGSAVANYAVAGSPLRGSSRIHWKGGGLDLVRQSSQTTLQSFGNERATASLAELTAGVTPEIYDAIFNFSLKNTPRNANRLATTLNQQLGVPVGSVGTIDEVALQDWHRSQETLRLQIADIDGKIAVIEREKSELLQHEAHHSQSRQQLVALDGRIAETQQRIGDLNTNPLVDQLASIDAEVQALRLRIDNARTEVIYPVAERGVDHGPLYAQLDELENQIRRWRHVQSDVQNQRVRLRDEMLMWNELTMDSDDHPYHNAREILVRLESRVDQAERSANHWADVGNTRVDTEQLAETLGQLCQTMRDDLYGLCDELSHQYKHLRHKSAATELKQLRRCYTEMGENIDRLVQRRATVVKEIHRYDPAGAAAIERRETTFCQCAQHEGYLEARKRYVGPFTAAAPDPVRIEPDLTHERSRLATLESERAKLHAELTRHDAEQAQLNRQLADLLSQRDALINQQGRFDPNRLASLNVQLSELSEQRRRLLVQTNQPQPQAVVDPILSRSDAWLSRLTNGEITKAYLVATTTGIERSLQAENAAGQPLAFESLQPGTQDQIYLSLALAAGEHLRSSRGVELPVVVDDAFSRISGDRINPTFELLNALADGDQQIILLSQHRYLADRIPGISVLVVKAPADSHVAPVAGTAIPVAPAATVSTNSSVAPHSIYAAQDQLDQHTAAAYPFSKYDRNDDVLVEHPPRIYSVPQDTNLVGQKTYNPEPAGRYSAVTVDNFAQPLAIDEGIVESAQLAATGLFESAEIRFLEEHRINTVADLLALEESAAPWVNANWDQLRQWQTLTLMIVAMPSLQPIEAKVLLGSGIDSLDSLAAYSSRDLYDQVRQFLNSNRFFDDRVGRSFSTDRADRWLRDLDRNRSRWQRYSRRSRRSGQSYTNNQRSNPDYRRDNYRTDADSASDRRSGYETESTADRRSRSDNSGRDRQRSTVAMPGVERSSRSDRDNRYQRSPRQRQPDRNAPIVDKRTVAPAIVPVRSVSDRQHSSDRRTVSEKTKGRSANVKLKFYLNLDDALEAAPSIGPKTAERFEKIGVVTVSDFLKQTAESMAEKLNYKRIDAKVIRQWQHQARLNCRVPNLRGHDVQLLVGCEITEAEELATMHPQVLFDKVLPFAESKEGLKIIRGGKQPDLAEITDWITWATENRSIQAA